MARFGHCIPVAALGLGLLGAPALAADLLPPPPPPPPLPAPVEVGSGWYLRGDYTASDFRHPKTTPCRAPKAPSSSASASATPTAMAAASATASTASCAPTSRSTGAPQPLPRLFLADQLRRGLQHRGRQARRPDRPVQRLRRSRHLVGLHPLYRRGCRHGEQPLPRRLDRHHLLHHRLRRRRRRRLPARGAGLRRPRQPHRDRPGLGGHGGHLLRDRRRREHDASYRYLEVGKARTGFDAYNQNTRIKDIAANEFRVGLRWAFGNGLALPGLAGSAY